MCGIIGFSGKDNAIPYLVEGIKNLEYRGYDSCGCAFLSDGSVKVIKDVGRIDSLISKFKVNSINSSTAIFHTRWATTGEVTKENAHPMTDCSKRIAVVHNGIIENWKELKESLRDHIFVSDTDTEVLAHLLEEKLGDGNTLADAAQKVYGLIRGRSSFVAIDSKTEEVVAVKKGSPLVLGVSKNGNFIASDVPSFIKYTNNVIFLNDGDTVVLKRNKYTISSMTGKLPRHVLTKVKLSHLSAGKGKYEHFMLKEIMEQPYLIKKLSESDFPSLSRAADAVKSARRVYILGSGTSFHASLIGAKMLREKGIDALAIQGQELKSFRKLIKGDDVFVLVSQSGETADLIEVLPDIEKNIKISVINVEGSTIARAGGIVININAGQEKAVASTKAFVMTSIFLTLLAEKVGGGFDKAIGELKLLNLDIYNIFVPSVERAMNEIAKRIVHMHGLFYLGIDKDYTVAAEGALKMKEIAYLQAESIDAVRFKHGPLALISKDVFSVAVVSKNTRDVILHNLDEIKARGGKIIGIADKPAPEFDLFIKVPQANLFDFVMPTIIMQLLAYKVAVLKKLDPDFPRNLAKSVTTK
jgi:glucosamine--fructose-6-phosphate aminotransferase (isomerizing)